MLSHDTQRLLFQLAGLYFIVVGLARLPGALAFIPNVEQLSLSFWLTSTGPALQLAIGVWLVVSSARWAKLFQRLRGGG